MTRRRTAPVARVAALAMLALLPLLAAACESPTASIPAAFVCEPDLDVRAAGAVPALEALLPRGMIERAPDTVDSGWNCTESSLGTYWTHDVRQLWFAGATWNYGGGDATVAAILRTPPSEAALQTSWVEEFYATGAARSTKTENIEVTRPTLTGAGAVYHLQTLNDLSLQTVVVWPAGAFVHVVIVATQVQPGASREEHDQRVATAVEVAAAVPVPSPR